MSRRARKLSSTDVYHIMMRGNERKSIFGGSDEKQRFMEILIDKQHRVQFAIYAYCLMDNHVHLLIDSGSDELASIMKSVAVSYASYYNWKHGRVGHVFQDRFRSEPIEDDRYLMAAVRYIHNNPVHAGVTAKPGDYLWSSYSKYVCPQSADWIDTNFLLRIIAEDRPTAIRNFERFSSESCEIPFIGCDEEMEIRTLYEGTAYLESYLKQNGYPQEIAKCREDKYLRTKIIQHLRTHTGLSQRTIAEIFRVDKGVVERVKMD